MRVLALAGESENERWAAARILPLLNHFHYVLVTLIASNAVCNEALPIVMAFDFKEVVAVILSITVITLFGE
jgi:hypothetical protein